MSVASKCTGVNLLGSAKEWLASEIQKIAGTQSHNYNKVMGGTDKMDKKIFQNIIYNSIGEK